MMGHLMGLYYTWVRGDVAGIRMRLPAGMRAGVVKGGVIQVSGVVGKGMSRRRDV